VTVAPGYPNPDEVAKARQGAMRAIALGQAVAVDHARVLLAALAFCELTLTDEVIVQGSPPSIPTTCAECITANAELCRSCAVDVKWA
jgi:hypothetical protein